MTIKVDFPEKDLEDYLAQYMSTCLEGLDFVTQQLETKAGIIDILAKDTRQEGLYYVIELKKDMIDANAICQVLRYTKYMNEHEHCDHTRTYIPLLIGGRLENNNSNVTKTLEFFQPEAEKPNYSNLTEAGRCRIYYRNFGFDFKDGLDFLYGSDVQQEYKKMVFNIVEESEDEEEDN